MGTVAIFVLGGSMVLLAAGLTTSLLRPESRLDAAITFGVVATAGVVTLMLIAGAFGILTRPAVLVLEAAWVAAAGALLRRRDEPWSAPGRPRIGAVIGSPWVAAIVALAALALAWQVLVALVLPPFAFDALTYHLPIVADWIGAENIEPSPLTLCCSYYPANAELLFTWPMLMADGDAVVDLTQFGFAALGSLAVAGLARSMGLGTTASAAAGGLFVLTPVVLVQAPTNYADVFVGAAALAGLHALVRFADTGRWQQLLVAGLAAGLLLGTKGTGIIWAALLTAAAVAASLRAIRTLGLSRRTARAGLAAFLCALLGLGSYWYARNWIETGNPAYPFEVKPAGVEIFDGPLGVDEVLTEPDAGADDPWPVAIVRSWATDLDFWNQGGYDYQQRSGGLGPVWSWLALPLLVPLAVGLARRRNTVLLALAVVAVTFLVQPYPWWSRFTIPLMGIGALAIVGVAAWAPRAWLRTAVQAAALVLALAGVAIASRKVEPASRADPLSPSELVGLIGAEEQERTLGRLFFPEYRFLERVPDDATIVVDLPAEPVRFVYPLFGSGLTRRVEAAAGPVPDDAWVVTSGERPLDGKMAGDDRFRLAADQNDVRVWQPVGGRAQTPPVGEEP